MLSEYRILQSDPVLTMPARDAIEPGRVFSWATFIRKLYLLTLVVILLQALAEASRGDAKVFHTNSVVTPEGSPVNGIVRGRGILVIECESYGNDIVVYRVGDHLVVADFFPRGSSRIQTLVIEDHARLTYEVHFKGGSGHDVYQNDTSISDKVYGNGGNDWLTCGFGYTYVSGGLGDDVIYLRTDSDPGKYNQAFGDEGRDVIYGSPFSDYLLGGDQGDYLEGGDGNDYILGGSGGDILFGNAGDDRLGGGFDGVADLLSGGEGSDEYTLYAFPGNNVNLDGSLYDVESEVIIDDGYDRRRIIRQNSPPRSMEIPYQVEQDFGNAEFIALIVEAYGEFNVFDPYLSNHSYDIEPIIAQSADDPLFLLPLSSFGSASTTTTVIKKNSGTKIRGW